MFNEKKLPDNHVDDWVDEEILSCINLENPKSFVLYAGAGSGKTRSLVKLLTNIPESVRNGMNSYGRQVAVITYTNAASDEIRSRIKFDSLYHISTIHSFAWTIIEGYTEDIRRWLKTQLKNDIEVLENKIERARKASAKEGYIRKRNKKEERLKLINGVLQFIYSPTGNNTSIDSLTHAEVIKICAFFINEEPVFREILIGRFPIILVDESQDTAKPLMEALLELQKKQSHQMTLGLFGDMMQRIYMDGMPNLEGEIPDSWERLDKQMNHRSQKRIVELVNSIRNNGDKKFQRNREDKPNGLVHAFLVEGIRRSIHQVETKVVDAMVDLTGDLDWGNNELSSRRLILEHRMAANRLGFIEVFNAINSVGSYKDSIKEGNLKELLFFTEQVFPLMEMIEVGDEYSTCQILDEYSERYSSITIGDPSEIKKRLDCFLETVMLMREACMDVEENISTYTLVKYLYDNKILSIPEDLESALLDFYEKEKSSNKSVAWCGVYNRNIEELRMLADYYSDATGYATHQGVKGLEYKHVMGIISDDEAVGNSFSYEKLFGVKELTITDKKNIREGRDSSLGRTNRLFYVLASRAEESLALVMYTGDTLALKKFLIDNAYFNDNEITVL